MESEDQFYLTLPSSASMDLFPYNTISDFRTELLNNIYLEREMYEVGLSEIILDAGVENVPNMQKAFVIYRSVNSVKNTLKIHGTPGILRVVDIRGIKYNQEIFYTQHGAYKSVSELIAYFNLKFMESAICKDLVFHTNKVKDDTAEIISLRSAFAVNLQDLNIFCFQAEHWFEKSILVSNNHQPSMKMAESGAKANLKRLQRYLPSVDEYIGKMNVAKTIHFICNPNELLKRPGMAYVYSDIVDHQYVGNTKAPLLRIVHFDRNVVTFPHIHYLPISKTIINTIRIYVRDVEGNAYPFTKGTAMYKVHIRKKNM